MSLNQARILAVVGGSGSGKSAWVKQLLGRERPRRLIIWDPKNEYHAGARTGLSWVRRVTLAELVKHQRDRRLAVAYVPGRDPAGRPIIGYTRKRMAEQFDFVCNVALATGDLALAVDELSLVTTPNKAPDPWAAVSNGGRHEGLTVIGASQFPAQIDKAFLGNATLIHCGMLGEPAHARAVARRIPGVTEEELLQLAPLQWIEYDKAARLVSRGRLAFR